MSKPLGKVDLQNGYTVYEKNGALTVMGEFARGHLSAHWLVADLENGLNLTPARTRRPDCCA
jgi:hypothetical protein